MSDSKGPSGPPPFEKPPAAPTQPGPGLLPVVPIVPVFGLWPLSPMQWAMQGALAGMMSQAMTPRSKLLAELHRGWETGRGCPGCQRWLEAAVARCPSCGRESAPAAQPVSAAPSPAPVPVTEKTAPVTEKVVVAPVDTEPAPK
jgi:hypothetical protein